MPLERMHESWTDIIDEKNYDQTGVALLYRNPKINSSLESTRYEPINHKYSLDPGENCIFKQKPIAYGFTAYISYNKTYHTQYSLRTLLKTNELGFRATDYYRNYPERLFEKYSINDKRKARPKSEKKLQTDFYTELLANEQKFYENSALFYSESQNEEDHAEKENLREYVFAFFDWIEDKLIDLNPNENQIKGLGGLREVEAEYIFKEFKGIYIHSKTKKEHFIAIFQNRILPDGWKRIEWVGDRADKAALFSFFDQVYSTEIKPGVIKKYFKVTNDNLHGHHRTITENPDIKKILENSKKL